MSSSNRKSRIAAQSLAYAAHILSEICEKLLCRLVKQIFELIGSIAVSNDLAKGWSTFT